MMTESKSNHSTSNKSKKIWIGCDCVESFTPTLEKEKMDSICPSEVEDNQLPPPPDSDQQMTMGANTSRASSQNDRLIGATKNIVHKTIYNGNSAGDKFVNGNGDIVVGRVEVLIDGSQLVGVTRFTIAFVLQCMSSSNDQEWEQLMQIYPQGPRRAEVSQISGIGYLSHIYRIKFFFDGLRAPFPVIMKVPSVANLSTISNCERFLSGWAQKLATRHNSELLFYDHFADRIRQTGKVHVPKLYAACKANSPIQLEQAFILMEDLDQNGKMASTIFGLDKEQVENMIEILAMIHALSLSVPNSADLLEKMRFRFSMDDEEGQARRTAVQGLLTIPEGEFFRQHRALLERLVEENDVMRFDVHKEFEVPPVLCHGDFWCNNLFLEKGRIDGRSPHLYAVLDWQFAHPNSGLVDFCRLVLLCSHSELRASNLDNWLNLYTRKFDYYCSQFGVPCPYDSGLVRWMFLAQYPSEMLFSFMILINHYAKVQEDGIKAELLSRMKFTLNWWIRAQKNKEDAMKSLMME